MEVDEDNSFIKRCYKCEYSPVLANLNIVYNFTNSKLFLWNKHQIFMYEDTEFECLKHVFAPEYQIHKLLVSNSHLLCLDCNGNVHINSLKFKNSNQKCLKLPSQSREQGIKACLKYNEDLVLSLKYEAGAYFLCLNKINTDFKLSKQVILLCDDEHWSIGENDIEKYLLMRHSLSEDSFKQLSQIFKIEDTLRNTKDLVLVSFDRHTVYGCIYSPKMVEEEIKLVKLYEAPAEICSMEVKEVDNLLLFIGLKMGAVIKLCFSNLMTEINYLNKSLDKMVVCNDYLIYTDGETTWRAENIFSKNNFIKFTQMFLKNIKDLTKCGDCMIATTYSNLIYKFCLEDQSCYLNSNNNEEYCPALTLINNTECWNKLFQQIDDNNEIVKKLQREEHFTTAIALSKRHDIISKAIDLNVQVFENYFELSNQEHTLTQDIEDYFAENTWQILVNINNSSSCKPLNDILTNLTDNISIYITLSTRNQTPKTTCVKMMSPLKSVKYLIPINFSTETDIKIDVKIAVDIPRALDQKKSLTVLYKKDINLTSEHFIRTSNRSVVKSLKNKENLENQIQKHNIMLYGSQFDFSDDSKMETNDNDWNFFIKLPNDYKNMLKSTNIHENSTLSAEKTRSIMQQLTSEEFLNAKKDAFFSVNNERIKIKIQNDGFLNPLLNITSTNAKTAYNIRKFFAKIINKEYENCEPGVIFINHSFYTTTENFQKAVKQYIENSNEGEFLQLMEQFEKNIIGALPI